MALRGCRNETALQNHSLGSFTGPVNGSITGCCGDLPRILSAAVLCSCGNPCRVNLEGGIAVQQLIRGLAHAFAVETAPNAEPTRPQRLVMDKLCKEVVRRRLRMPTLMALETIRPLSFLGAQSLYFLGPILSTFSDSRTSQHLAEFLEKRGSIEYLCNRIESLENESINAPCPADHQPGKVLARQSSSDVPGA